MRFSLSRSLIKTLSFLGAFLILHYTYDITHQAWTAVFSGTRETFIEHAKIGIFAWTLVSAIEVLLRQKMKPLSRLVYPRLSAALLLPWLMFLLFYLTPVITGGPMPSELLEIILANVVTICMAVLLTLLEQDLERFSFTPYTRALVTSLYCISLGLLVAFTYRIPWAPFF